MEYKPTKFMLSTSHYDKAKADRAVAFISNLKHTKGRWSGVNFELLPWQEQIVRDLFGVIKADGKRQFLTAFVEISKKNGKSELAAAIAFICSMPMVKQALRFTVRQATVSRLRLFLTLLKIWLRCVLQL